MNRALERLGPLWPIRRKLIVVAFRPPHQRGHYYNELLGYKDSAHALGLIPCILVPHTTEPHLTASLLAESVLEPFIETGSAYVDATQNLEPLWAALAAHDPTFRDILLFTSGHPVAIAGIGLWLARRPRRRRPSAFFRIIGDECIDAVPGRPPSVRIFFRMACSDLRTRAGQERVFLLGSSQAIVRRASRAACRRVFLTPLPKHLAFAPGTDSAKPEQPTVYVHLNPRSGRFIRGLGDIIRRVTADEPHIRFVVKHGSLSAEIRSFLDSELASLAEILPAEQDTADYLASLRKCTLVLLPYEPEVYTTLSSGVFVEAVSCGKPVVVPGGTWMAQQIALGRGVGTLFEHSSLESITRALQQALSEVDNLCVAASALASVVRFENSSQRYVEKIVTLIRERPDMEPRYQIGDEVDFSDPSDSRCYMREGWGEAERWGVRSTGRRASLLFRLEERRALVLRALVQPFLTTTQRRIVVCVSIAGREVERWILRLDGPEADRPRWCEAQIPMSALPDPGTALELSFSVAAPSSEAEGPSADEYALGFGLHKMSLG